MSGICGWTGFEMDSGSSRGLIQRMVGELTRFDAGQSQVILGRNSAVASASPNHLPEIFQDQDVLVAISGNPKWSDSSLADLARSDGHAKALAVGYRDKGPQVLQSLLGSFSIALLCEKKGEIFLAIDRMGICPLNYTLVESGFVFGSTLRAIHLHPKVVSKINPQGIFNYVYFEVVPAPGTIYQNQYALLPGTYLHYLDGKIRTETYWKIKYEERARNSTEDLKHEFRSLLQKSICEAANGGSIGAFLSGGTDSSTVAGILTEIQGRPAKTYSIGFEADGYNEMEYARIAARHFKTDQHEYYVTPEDIIKAAPKIAEIYGQPYGNASAVPAYYCARMAKEDGITKLLGGDGGDELFGGNARYVTHYLFSLYDALPAMLKRNVIEPLVLGLPDSDRFGLLYKLRRYVEQASLPMPERTQTYNLLNHFGAENVFERYFLEKVFKDEPIHLLKQVYEDTLSDSTLHRELAMDLKFTLADNDLPKIHRMSELAGVESAFPLLSDEIVDFSAKLPVKLKLNGIKLRFFFKEALRDFLPPEIITKKKHGFGLPFGLWLKTHKPLQNFTRDSLDSLKNRGIFRPPFIDELIAKHQSAHATYYGSLLWRLLMLELWHQCHYK